LSFLIVLPQFIFAQKWVDTLFSIETIKNVEYGTSIDFAGNERSLLFDLSYPNNDTLEDCGRPLIIMIHGGAFIAGSKDDASPSRFRKDFAKRGYAVASMSYRLGQFHTEKNVHCNVSSFGIDWDCMNMTDTSEWYRAYYRGVQDVNGCIRYLINHAQDYNIDANNVFLIGESAGGFLAMGAAYIDDDSEVLMELISSMSDAPAPNSIYEAPCIQHPTYNLDTSIISMNLERPHLGDFTGSLNIPLDKEYKIQGVANFFGGAFNNIFKSFNEDTPALYLFHQPNDLIVPIGHSKVLQGLSVCASGFPFNCQAIINRPFTYGSSGISSLIDELEMAGEVIPEYLFENSGNTANCALQILDPTLQGHSIDNYWLRTTNVASFFASHLSVCLNTSTYSTLNNEDYYSVFPNPVSRNMKLTIQGAFSGNEILTLYTINGEKVLSVKNAQIGNNLNLNLDLFGVEKGLYLIEVKTIKSHFRQKVVLIN
jgi:predicted esterase